MESKQLPTFGKAGATSDAPALPVFDERKPATGFNAVAKKAEELQRAAEAKAGREADGKPDIKLDAKFGIAPDAKADAADITLPLPVFGSFRGGDDVSRDRSARVAAPSFPDDERPAGAPVVVAPATTLKMEKQAVDSAEEKPRKGFLASLKARRDKAAADGASQAEATGEAAEDAAPQKQEAESPASAEQAAEAVDVADGAATAATAFVSAEAAAEFAAEVEPSQPAAVAEKAKRLGQVVPPVTDVQVASDSAATSAATNDVSATAPGSPSDAAGKSRRRSKPQTPEDDLLKSLPPYQPELKSEKPTRGEGIFSSLRSRWEGARREHGARGVVEDSYKLTELHNNLRSRSWVEVGRIAQWLSTHDDERIAQAGVDLASIATANFRAEALGLSPLGSWNSHSPTAVLASGVPIFADSSLTNGEVSFEESSLMGRRVSLAEEPKGDTPLTFERTTEKDAAPRTVEDSFYIMKCIQKYTNAAHRKDSLAEGTEAPKVSGSAEGSSDAKRAVAATVAAVAGNAAGAESFTSSGTASARGAGSTVTQAKGASEGATRKPGAKASVVAVGSKEPSGGFKGASGRKGADAGTAVGAASAASKVPVSRPAGERSAKASAKDLPSWYTATEKDGFPSWFDEEAADEALWMASTKRD